MNSARMSDPDAVTCTRFAVARPVLVRAKVTGMPTQDAPCRTNAATSTLFGCRVNKCVGVIDSSAGVEGSTDVSVAVSSQAAAEDDGCAAVYMNIYNHSTGDQHTAF